MTRSYDQRQHTYLGYVLFIRGTVGSDERQFSVAIGKAAQAKHQFMAGDMVSGVSYPVTDSRMEAAEFYKASALTKQKCDAPSASSPPYTGIAPELPVYRARGHRRLAAQTYTLKCCSCIWGCKVPVVMIVDHWNPGNKRYRFETFCYGPKSCPSYKAGPERKVPGRKGMSYTEENWSMRSLLPIVRMMTDTCWHHGTSTPLSSFCSSNARQQEVLLSLSRAISNEHKRMPSHAAQ